MKLIPQNNRIIVELIERAPNSTIVVPDNVDKSELSRFIVREVGQGQLLDDGTRIPIPLAPGDEVVLNPNCGFCTALVPEWLYGDKKYMAVEYKAVIAKVERDAGEIEKLATKALQPKIIT